MLCAHDSGLAIIPHELQGDTPPIGVSESALGSAARFPSPSVFIVVLAIMGKVPSMEGMTENPYQPPVLRPMNRRR